MAAGRASGLQKTELWGVAWLSALSEVQTCIWPSGCHCHSLCFSKIQTGFTFLVPVHLGSPGKRAIKRMCVCFIVLPRVHQTDNKNNYYTRLKALCPGLPRWAGTRKVEPIWILLKQETVSGSGVSWAVCKSAPSSRQTTMPAPHHSVFLQAGCPSCRPTNSVKALIIKTTTT